MDPASRDRDGREARFAGWVAAAFLLAGAPRLWRHELWRDEATSWLLAAEVGSWAELRSELAWGGHGYLWAVLCWGLRAVVASPRAMQLLNLTLASATVWVLVRRAPLPRRERLLLAAGYFFSYEYAILSRDYAAGSLLIVLACAATAARKPALALGSALCLLFQSTLYGLVLGTTIAAGWLLDRWQGREGLPLPPRRELLLGGGLAAAGAVAGVLQVLPAPGGVLDRWHTDWMPWRAARALRIPWRAFVPLPAPELQFWNTNVLDPWPAVQTVAGLATLLVAVAFLRRSRPALLTFGLGTGALLALSYTKFHGSARHHGHLWLLFVAALWLGGGLPRARRRDWRRPALLAFLTVQVAAGLFASWIDWRHPFSNGAAAARSIRERGLQDLVLIGFRDSAVPAVALPLGQPLYMPSVGRFATRPDWGPRRKVDLTDLRCEARGLAESRGRDVLLVLDTEQVPRWPEASLIGSRLGAIVGGEDFHLLRLHRDRLAATAGRSGCAPAEARPTPPPGPPASAPAATPRAPARARARPRSAPRPRRAPPASS